MSTVNCRYCGIPFHVRRNEPGQDYFCCSGCALLARVPVDAQGNFPVNAHLVWALALGFLYFNQLLAWAVAALLLREGRAALADRFWWITISAAFAVWLGVFWLQHKEKVARGKDYAFGIICLTLLGAAFVAWPPRGGLLAAANAIWLGWAFRGLLRRKVSS
jgi:hypothetical protein